MHGWTRTLTQQLLAAGAVCAACGCTVMTPYQLWHVRADYNTERRWAAQIEVREHLPPHPPAVRTMAWAYNVGPTPPQSAEWMIPVDAPVDPIVPVPSGVRPGGPSKDLLEQAEPPDLPAAPPRGARSGSRTPSRDQPTVPADDAADQGPMALWPERIRPIGYQAPAGTAARPKPDPTAAWLFAR